VSVRENTYGELFMENVEDLSLIELIDGLNFMTKNSYEVQCNYLYCEYLYWLNEKCPKLAILYR